MTGYGVYVGAYGGRGIPEDEWGAYARRAEAELGRYKRVYTVTGGADAEMLAVCAMAEALYGFGLLPGSGAVRSASVGSVSVGYDTAGADLSAEAQSRELYRRACRYLDISRGAG